MTIRRKRLHDTQRRIVKESRRFNVVVLGRRAGKTVLGQNRAMYPALHGQPVAWFAPNYKYLADAWRDLLFTLGPVISHQSLTEHRLELLTGGLIDFWTLDTPDSARGRKYKRVIIDEAAMVPNLADIWQMAIRPTLTDLIGDAWFLSTPRGMNYFHALYEQGQDDLQPDWMSWKMPTSVNPFLPVQEIEDARLSEPERIFAQEYLAEFLPDGTGVFRGVERATTLKPAEPEIGHVYVMGVDWGKVNDFTVFSVLDATAKRQVAIERTNKIDYAFQVDRLVTLFRKYRPSRIVVESNSIGVPIIEQLLRRNLPIWPFNTTNASKADAIEGLSLALERQVLGLLDDPIQKSELIAYDSERLPSGMIRYTAPEGMHDDTVIALALAWTAIAHQGPGKVKLTMRF